MTLIALSRRAVLGACALALAAGFGLSPVQARAEGITVFAAASLKNALDAVAADWKAETGNSAAISYAGSSQLAKQIEQGAPADLFISADLKWMDTLQKENLIKTDTRHNLLGNTLVLVAHDAAAKPVTIAPGFDLAGMLGAGKLSMATVNAVPAGIYGKTALTRLGIWDAVSAKVAQSDNVRAALRLVALGEAPYGIVYSTDAAAEPGVKVVATFPENTHDPIIYPAALTATATKPEAAAFLAYLSGAKARAEFEKQGFTMLAN